MMNKMMKLLLVAAASLVTSPLLAQSSTQGAIGGTVFDTTDAVVPKAAVTIHNDGTNADIHLSADDSGYFKAPLVEPGTYTVTILAKGFRDYRANQVIVQVGQLTTVTPHLVTGSESQVVEVTAEAPILNFESPDFSSNLNKKTLDDLPINNRRWSSLAMTTPGVVSDSNGFGLVSIRGISPILNNVLIDGADDNQAFFSEERGRTREAYSTSASAVREFAVNTGVYGAEYGRAAGGVINSVTKSGTNQIHGEAYFYDRESNWNAYNAYSKITTPTLNPATGGYTFPTTPLKPEDVRKIYGFTAGGALIKDKLFWIYTYDQHSRIFPGTAIPSSAASFYALPDLTLPATCSIAANGFVYNTANSTQACSADSNSAMDSQAAVLAIRQGQAANAAGYANGAKLYQAGIVGLQSDLGTVPRTGYQEINTPKLDWQINQKEHVSFLYHRLRWDSPGGVQTSATNDYGLDTWGNDFVKLDYGVAKLTSLLSTKISNELLYQYGRELNDETQQPFSAYTLANLVGTGGNVPEVALDTSVFANIGSPYYSYRLAYPDERKWQIGDVLHYTKSNHNFTFGGDTVHNWDLLNNLYEANGYIVYSYLGNYINDLLNKGKSASSCGSQTGQAPTSTTTTGWTGTLPCYSTSTQGFGASPTYAITTFDYSVFGQDNWKISPRLTLELGARYDYEFLPSPSANLTGPTGSYVPFPGVTNHPSDKNNVGVRIGFADDVFGDGKTVLRGGYGIFYGRITNGVLLNTLLNTGSPNGQYTSQFKPATAGAPVFPNIVQAASGTVAAPGVYYLGPHLQNPQVHEYDLVLQQEIGRGTIFSMSYLGALGRELPNFLDLNLDPTTVVPVTITVSDTSGKGPLPNGAQYVVPTYTKYGNKGLFGSVATNFQNITEVVSNVNSTYNALVAEVQNRSIHNLQFDFNFTWAHALDFAQNATTTTSANSWYDPYSNARANYGNSNYNVPTRFVGYALYTFPVIHSSAWYTYASNGWSIDTSFQAQSGLPYTTGVSGFNSNDAILGDWNGAGGTTAIPGIGLNTNRQPRKIVDDMRVQKQFTFAEKYNLQLLANVFNIANHQNIDGVGATAYKLSSGAAGNLGVATFQPATFAVPTSSNNSGFLYTPRQIEIGARFVF
ncbi:MAG TPA: TonB-dependent receptor [Edaphobacter sp.]|nr:TonB-dependent receptor [Edaphobacter sp.]